MALLTVLSLILLAGASPPPMQSLVTVHPTFEALANLLSYFLVVSLVAFAFFFPDGRCCPKWALAVLIAWATALGFLEFAFGNSPISPSDAVGALVIPAILGGIASQIYRYFRVSGPAQRKQTKWAAFGLALALGINITYTLVAPNSLSMNRPGTGYDLGSNLAITLGYLLVPITLAIAIFRYSLWDIDFVLNRALVYASLTLGVVVLYVLIVGGLGSLLEAKGNFWLSLTAAGLVAVSFQPMRVRLQRGVDNDLWRTGRTVCGPFPAQPAPGGHRRAGSDANHHRRDGPRRAEIALCRHFD